MVVLYDTYSIHTDIDNLVNFIGRYNKNRLTNSCKTRQFILDKHYKKFVNENITVVNDSRRISFNILLMDFYKWINKFNIPTETEIMSNQNNFNTKFMEELRTKIEEFTGIKSIPKISIFDMKRNIRCVGGRGWEGLELKSTEQRAKYFNKKDYTQFFNSKILRTYNQKDKIVGRFLAQEFISWASKNNIEFLRGDDYRGKDKFSTTFFTEFIESIEIISGVKYFRNRGYKGIKGVFWYLKFKTD